MRPAKIGQLTPKDNRSQPIDQSHALNCGVLVVPPAQRAWLCGHAGNVDHGNVCDCGAGSGQSKEDTSVAAKCTVDAVTVDAVATIAESTAASMLIQKGNTNLPRCSQVPTRDDNSTEYRENIDIQLSAPSSRVREKLNINIDENFRPDKLHETKQIRTANTKCPLLWSKSCQDYEKINVDSTRCSTFLDKSSVDRKSPVRKVTNTSCQTCKKGPTDIPDLINIVGPESCKYNFLFRGDAGKKSFHWTKHQDSLLADNQSNSSSDMNVKEPMNSCAYANFSSSSAEEWEPESCSYNHRNNKQILSVGGFACSKGRPSHQYLNSSITEQNYPNFTPETFKSYRCSVTNSEAGTGPDLELQPRMVICGATSKETSFADTDLDQHLQLTPSHHYYNKSSLLNPISRDQRVPLSNNRSQNCDHQNIKNHFIATTCSMQGDKAEQDLDLTFSPKQPRLQFPVHLQSSPSASPQHQFPCRENCNQHPDHEQQELLSQYQPTAHNRRYPHQNRPRVYSIHSVSSLIRHIRCGRHSLRFSPVSFLWTFLSVLVAGTSLLTFLTPYWTVHPDHIHSFGLFNLCIRDQRFSHSRPLCINFGHQHYHFSISVRLYATSLNSSSADIPLDRGTVDIARIPSGAWQAACLLFGVGVFVQILGALVSLVVLALREPWHHRMALVNGYMQTVGVLLLVSGLLLYPVGFGSPFYSYYCDSTRAYRTGHCTMGWSYVTAIMITALSIFCPVMSSFVEAHQAAGKPVINTDTTVA